jgi:hypothetical protein
VQFNLLSPRRSISLIWIITPLIAVSVVSAGGIKIAWDPVPGASGYTLHYGRSASNLSSSVNVGNSSQFTLTGLADCVDWHFGVNAYNSTNSGPISALVVDWPRPRIDAVTPGQLRQGDQQTLNVRGVNFRPSAQLTTSSAAVALQNVARLDCENLQTSSAIGPLGAGDRPAPIGPVELVVTNPNGIRNSAPGILDVLINRRRFDMERGTPETEDRLNGADLSRLTATWGGCDHPQSPQCSSGDQALYQPDHDLNGDGWIDGEDLAYIVTSRWGRCWSNATGDYTAQPTLDPNVGFICTAAQPG